MGRIWLPGGGGGGASSDDCTLMGAAVPAGMKAVTADSDDEAMEGTLNPDTTLADSQALSGQTFLKWNPQTKLFEKRTGDMANKGAWTGSVAMNGSITIPAGFHNGSGNVKGPVITNRGNYGGTGNSRGNDTSGKRMWVKVPGGYYNENAQVFLNWSDICSMAGLTADKLKKDVSIMDIIGTVEPYIQLADLKLNLAKTAGTNGSYSSGDWVSCYPSNAHFCIGRNDPALLLDDYNYLSGNIEFGNTEKYHNFTIYVGLSTNASLTSFNFAKSFSASFASSITTFKLDISSLKGKYFLYAGIKFNAGSTTTYSVSVYMRQVKLSSN